MARPPEASDGERNEFVHRDDLLPGVISTAVGYRSTGATPRQHRGMPSPFLTLIFSLDEPIVSARRPDELDTAAEISTSIVTAGLQTSAAYVKMPADQAGIQLAVHPLAARVLLGASSAELGFVVDGADVLGIDAERLRWQLIESPDWDRRFAVLRRYLCNRIDRAGSHTGQRPDLQEAWRWLQRSGGTGSVTELSRHVALSTRQLNTIFTRELGMGPKSVGRLMRFTRATRSVAGPLQTGDEHALDLARVAADCGYYDQSHLVRDFQSFIGISPTGWLAEERRNIQDGGHRNGTT